jgi:prolyl oligopeptidase
MPHRSTCLYHAALHAGAAFALAAGAVDVAAQTSGAPPLSYPETRRADQADVYHGVRVAAPNRWLEDTDAPDT